MQGERHKGRNVRVPQPGECGAGHISAIGGWDDIPAQVWCIRYNEVGGFFTVDLSIASTGEVLVYGDIVRYGRPLFNSVEDERFPVPVIMPLCLTGDDISEVTFENFGKEVRLYLWERNAA